MKRNEIRVYPYLIKRVKDSYLTLNITLASSQCDKKTEKAILYDIAEIGGFTVNGINIGVIQISCERNFCSKINFLSELQRFAQDNGLTLVCNPIGII